MDVIKHEEGRMEIGLPDAITAEHWRKFHAEKARNLIKDEAFTAQMVPIYMGALALLEYGKYEDANGNTHNILEEKLNVPSYVMSWISTEVQRRLGASLEIPKFSSSKP